MKTNIENRIKIIALAVCIFLTITSFSTVAFSHPTPNPIPEDKDNVAYNFKQSQSEPAKNNTEVKLKKSDKSGITIENTINVGDLIIETVQVNDELYHKISLSDYFFTTEVGKPQIPTLSTLLAVPDSIDLDLEVLSSEYTTLDGYTVYPVPETAERKNQYGDIYCEEVFSIDKEFYSTDVFYPDTLVEIECDSYIRDQRVVRLSFHPVQYNPVTQELRVYLSIEIKIRYGQYVDLDIKEVGPYDSVCSNLILNYESPKTILVDQNRIHNLNQGSVSYPSDLSDPNNTADYLIITSDEFYYPAKQDYNNGTLENRLNELAHWRASYNRFDVAVVNVNDSFIGGNVDINIKEFIEYVYHNWNAPHMSDNHVGYILLVGDTPFVESHHIGNFVSDRWYGFMVGNDVLPDIMIGRFSVDDYSELESVAEKTIHYEQNPEPGDWHKNASMFIGDHTTPSWWSNKAKEILLELGGWNAFEVFKREGGTGSDVRDNINNGRSIVVYCGHGASYGWACLPFGSASVSQLTNGYKLPLVYSLTCHTGEFQIESYDCFGEVFVNTPNKGAVAFFGASKITNLGSSYFSKYLFESIFENFEYIVGKIITEGIIQMGGGYLEYNLLGDPALDLSGSTGHPNKPDLALSHLNITVSPQIHGDPELTITSTILNIGGGTAENVTVRFIAVDYYGEQYIIGEQTVSEIPPRNHSTITQFWNISGEFGNKSVIVQIDPNDSVDEAYELNNQAGIKVTILQDTTYVDDDYDENTPGWGVTHFDNIADGIYWVVENETVHVFNGTYYEQVVIDKPIHLIGQNKNNTIIDSSGTGEVIKITADLVNINNFTVQNGANAGIQVESNHNAIMDNTIANNNNGIFLKDSSNNVIKRNNITNNSRISIKLKNSPNNTIVDNNLDLGGILIDGELLSVWNTHTIENNHIHGKPIYYYKNNNIGGTAPSNGGQLILANCSYFIIENLIFSDASTAIQLGFSSNTTISGNTILNTMIHGIYLAFSFNNIISRNTFCNNSGDGASLFFSDNNDISGNTITSNDNGIYLQDSSDNTISENTITNNNKGIYIHDSDNNNIDSNTIKDNNDDAVYLRNSVDNTFRDNNINVYESSYGYGFYFSSDSDLDNDIDTSNTINGIHGVLVLSNIETLIIIEDIHIEYPTNIRASNRGLINLYNCRNVTIENCTAANNSESGIYLYDSSDNNIIGNTITSNDNGIYFKNSLDNTITNCTIFNNTNGIKLSGASNNNTISRNIITENNYGINLMDSSDNILMSNIITSNTYGISLKHINAVGANLSNNTLIRNTVINNDYGIYLNIASDNVITGNTIENSTYGIYLIGSSLIFPAVGSDNNIISENVIKRNAYGINITTAPFAGALSINNHIYHNNFINNTQNAYDRCNNTWYNATLEQGNYWDDHLPGHPGYPEVYNISGGSNQDLYPLIAPYPPLPDLIISDFTATYNGHIVQLTATVKNNGTADVDVPFQVSFSRSPTYTSPSEVHYNSIIDIGTVEIPLLPAGETAEATVYWKFLPEVNIIGVFADSTRVIEESNESNNRASITV